MEKLVEDVINENFGVDITDLEKILNQSRLRLGYIAKKLLNEGKIKKIGNKYYSINQLQY